MLIRMIKAVVFDLGGVVIDFANYRYYIHLSKISKVPVYKVREIIEKRQLDLLERDATDIHSFERYIAKRLGITQKRVGWGAFFRKTASMNLDVEQLVETL